MTGVSGSGKTSLAIETLSREAQRRYLETCSPALQRLLGLQERPDADRIDRLPVSIELPQLLAQAELKQTVWSFLGLLPLLAELLNHIGELRSPYSSQPMQQTTLDQVIEQSRHFEGRFQIGFLWECETSQQQETTKQRLLKYGFTESRIHYLPSSHQLLTIVDRFTSGESAAPERLGDSMETALSMGLGCFVILKQAEQNPENHTEFLSDWTDPQNRYWKFTYWGDRPTCACSGFQLTKLTRQALIHQMSSLLQLTTKEDTELLPFHIPLPEGSIPLLQLLQHNSSQFQQWLSHWKTLPQNIANSHACQVFEQWLQHLQSCELDHIPLSTRLSDVSRGEVQRLRLIKLLNKQLLHSMIVLDEPSRGLHPGDRTLLWPLLKKLSADNLILMIEHDPHWIAQAQRVLVLGPEAGEQGGELVFDGHLSEYQQWQAQQQPTNNPLSELTTTSTAPVYNWNCEILREKNPLTIPLNKITYITGRSGAGKSQVLKSLTNDFSTGENGLPQLNVELVDHEPLSSARHSRSIPVTVLKLFDAIRQVFSETADAQKLQLTAGDFSFNSKGRGRCPECRGTGLQSIQLDHLGEASFECEHCQGTRYVPLIHSVRWQNQSIVDVLNSSVQQAISLFRHHSKILSALLTLRDVGLGYLKLGQPVSTLSGGERQRLLLATHLVKKRPQQTVFLFDEPSAGLNDQDLIQFQQVFVSLIELGHTVILADHRGAWLPLVQWIIELKGSSRHPLSGVQFAGTPAELTAQSAPMTTQLDVSSGT